MTVCIHQLGRPRSHVAHWTVRILMVPHPGVISLFVFFFNDPAPPEIYPLSLPDALPIYRAADVFLHHGCNPHVAHRAPPFEEDRKSTRLNSSHGSNSYAVFCLKKQHLHVQNHIHEGRTITSALQLSEAQDRLA